MYRELGAEVAEIELPDFSEAMGAWVSVTSAELANAYGEAYPSRADEFGEVLRGLLARGHREDGRSVAAAWRTRIAFSRRLEATFEDVDAMLCPVLPELFVANTNMMDLKTNPAAAVAGRFTSPFNLSGSPSLTLPCGFDREGAPIGFQIVGPHLQETRLLSLGTAFQAATDWHSKRPPLDGSPGV